MRFLRLLAALAIGTLPAMIAPAPARADSFLTAPEFWEVPESERFSDRAPRADSLIAFLDATGNLIAHGRAIADLLARPHLAEEVLARLEARAAARPEDPAALFDLGLARMTLHEDLRGLADLERARRVRTDEAVLAAPPRLVVAERDDVALWLALALCYAQADAFTLARPWADATGLKVEAVLAIERAWARAAATAGLPGERARRSVLEAAAYMALYPGFEALLRGGPLAERRPAHGPR